MKNNSNPTTNQAESKKNTDLKKDPTVSMALSKAKTKSKKKSSQSKTLSLSQQQELIKKAKEVMEGLEAQTWKTLEIHGPFKRNDKIRLIADDRLIVGCDVSCDKHSIRAIDSRGIELSSNAFVFKNDKEGFRSALTWMLILAAENGKKQIVLGLEPTGHYWFNIAEWMEKQGITVVQVNPYAVKQTKEVPDNSQLKSDDKDPLLIALLVIGGNYSLPYQPSGVYADLRELTTFRDQVSENRTREVNRLHRELTIYFPEYKDAFGENNVDGAFALTLLKEAPLPKDLVALGTDGICAVWHAGKLRGIGYKRAGEILKTARDSIGRTEGTDSAEFTIKMLVSFILQFDRTLKELEKKISETWRKIPNAELLLEIPGLGETIIPGLLADIGDISRFDDAKELQKMAGLALVAQSSGKHDGQSKISHRGRKRMRTYAFMGAASCVAHDPGFAQLHQYYTTRPDNPLKKMQSMIVIACKILRIVYTILTKGIHYDRGRMLRDIVRPA